MVVEPLTGGAIDFAAVDNGVWTVHVFSAKGFFLPTKHAKHTKKGSFYLKTFRVPGGQKLFTAGPWGLTPRSG
jgi:hypothetical protein